MKFLITGARGQLGGDLMKALKARGLDAAGTDVQDTDITDASAVSALFAREKPDTVIHGAAYTATDKAETEREICRAANEDGTRNIARAAQAAGAALLCVSTDYVFNGAGDAPFDEDAAVGPLCWYGATKEAGERAARESCPGALIVRTSWVFGAGGGNFVKTMLRLGRERPELRVVEDQVGSPTYTPDLADALIGLALCRAPAGNYHATNAGYVSWADFAREIMRQAGLPARVVGIPTSEYPTPAVRPHNSRLSGRKLAALGLSLPPWQDALARFIKELRELEA